MTKTTQISTTACVALLPFLAIGTVGVETASAYVSEPQTLVSTAHTTDTFIAINAIEKTERKTVDSFLLASNGDDSWQRNSTHLRGKLDLDFSFDCPANGQIGPVYGSGVYSDESSVCSAAVHAGVLDAQEGGSVTIRTRPAQTAYASSERNGVITEEAGSGQGSFIFLSSLAPTNEPIDWSYNVMDLRGRFDQSFNFTCLPNGEIQNVWGSDLYTDDSSVCSAAVHAGIIDVETGGQVSIRMISGQGAYTSSSRNGVSTIGYGNWHGSYIFLR
jgi:hypothetical protein